MDQLNNTLENSISNLSTKMDEVNLTLQETASDIDSLNNSLGKISSSISRSQQSFYASLLISQVNWKFKHSTNISTNYRTALNLYCKYVL